MSFSRSSIALLLALCLSACTGFGVTPATSRRGAVARPVRPELARWDLNMKSKEDIEFEEWARKKKIAAGVDPDEDFGAGRRAENSIYLVGGARENATRQSISSRVCDPLTTPPPNFRRSGHCACAPFRWHLGLQ